MGKKIISEKFRIINSPDIFSPAQDEAWECGSKQEIKWDPISDVCRVKIDYSMDDGKTWQPISGYVKNAGIFIWTLPNVISNNCQIKIEEVP